MKTECPKSVWVAIRTYIPQDRAAYAYESKPKMLPQYKGLMVLKRYHLHPGNELARALNLINNMVIWTPSEVAKRLKRFNFRVRWSQKLGRFV